MVVLMSWMRYEWRQNISNANLEERYDWLVLLACCVVGAIAKLLIPYLSISLTSKAASLKRFLLALNLFRICFQIDRDRELSQER